ncbi:MAG: hypothetical protein ACRDZ9_04685 [Acidimicrobiales bacterium]
MFTAVAATAVAWPGPLDEVALVVDLVLFALGCVAFVWSLLRAAARSRSEQLHIAGLYLLAGSAPRGVRQVLLGLVGVQVFVALAGAMARPYTPLAFGILVPVYGLGLCGAWAAGHGQFPRRP